MENIDIDIDKEILENIDIDKEILENIDMDKISNRLEFGISNRATCNSDAVQHNLLLRRMTRIIVFSRRCWHP